MARKSEEIVRVSGDDKKKTSHLDGVAKLVALCDKIWDSSALLSKCMIILSLKYSVIPSTYSPEL